MFAVIDCGTTMTRIFIVNENRQVIASGRKKVGVRDTSITGSKSTLRSGVTELFFQILRDSSINDDKVEFAIASGMITSEIGLIEIPHLVAPVGIKQLTEGIVKVEDDAVLPLHRPIYFIRGIKNIFPQDGSLDNLRYVDFMRGEETQCIGVMDTHKISYPCNIVALSSHTKLMCINEKGEIEASMTSISGQFYEALISSTNIGKSLVERDGEEPGKYTYEQLVEAGLDCASQGGLVRSCMFGRFLDVLFKTTYKERRAFINSAIAADDLLAFEEMRQQGYKYNSYIFYGQEVRCQMYSYLIKKKYGDNVTIETIFDKTEVDDLTIRGAIAIALQAINNERKNY